MTNDLKSSVNIVVLLALPEEHDCFLERYPATADISTDNHVRQLHDIGVSGYNLISVLAQDQGADNAAAAAYEATNDLYPDLLVCLGIAGALSKDMNLGDIAVSSEIIDVLHSTKVSDVGKSSSRNDFSPRTFQVDPALQAGCRFFRSHPNLKVFLHEWAEEAGAARKAVCARFEHEIEGLSTLLETKFLIGPIICGPVVGSKALKARLLDINRKALAIETESGSIFRVARDASIPAITIRGISDHADPAKGKLETSTGDAVRKLAMQNVMSFFQKLTANNPGFMQVAGSHAEERRSGRRTVATQDGPSDIFAKAVSRIQSHLEETSAEYKNCPNDAPLPIPRVQKLQLDDDPFGEDDGPITLSRALKEDRRIFVKVAKSYPEKAIAWSMAQALLRHEIDGRQVLPIVVEASQMGPPNSTIERVADFDIKSPEVSNIFHVILILNDPDFHSRTKLAFIAKEINGLPANTSAIVVTKSESPIEGIDFFKQKCGLVEYHTSSVPFAEIAAYLERAFEMDPREADSVAARLEDTFSRFRLNTHPAYFIGIEEATLAALINANQRGELIQLAVGGILSFIVAADKSEVKLSRTTREEFLRKLSFEIKVEKKNFTKSDLVRFAEEFGTFKALEVEPMSFLKGFFDIGLLTDCTGYVTFSLPYVEAYLLSE